MTKKKDKAQQPFKDFEDFTNQLDGALKDAGIKYDPDLDPDNFSKTSDHNTSGSDEEGSKKKRRKV